MNNFLRRIIKVVIHIFIKIGMLFNPKFIFESMNAVAEEGSSILNGIVTYNLRPSKSDQIYNLKIEQQKHPRTFVVMQGPIMVKDNFTLETIMMYKKIMPQAQFVVSTWNNTESVVVQKIKDVGVTVLLNEPPSKSGMGNINYQVKSTNAGLKYAKDNGAEYVLKTRTDQRLERPFLLEYLFSLLKQFPVGSEYAYLMQESRIIVGQGTTSCTMFIPYFIADFYYFGTINDIMGYFDYDLQDFHCPYDERLKLLAKWKQTDTVYEYTAKSAPEIMLARNYLSMKGKEEISDSVKDYWNFIKNNFVCVSHNDVQLYWPKYERMKLENKIHFLYYPGDDDSKAMIYNWTFQNWLNLYTGNLIYTEQCEKLANMPATNIGSGII